MENVFLFFVTVNIVASLGKSVPVDDNIVSELQRQAKLQCPPLSSNINASSTYLSQCETVKLSSTLKEIELSNVKDFLCLAVFDAELRLCKLIANGGINLPKNFEELTQSIDKIRMLSPEAFCNSLKDVSVKESDIVSQNQKESLLQLYNIIYGAECTKMCVEFHTKKPAVLCSLIYLVDSYRAEYLKSKNVEQTKLEAKSAAAIAGASVAKDQVTQNQPSKEQLALPPRPASTENHNVPAPATSVAQKPAPAQAPQTPQHAKTNGTLTQSKNGAVEHGEPGVQHKAPGNTKAEDTSVTTIPTTTTATETTSPPLGPSFAEVETKKDDVQTKGKQAPTNNQEAANEALPDSDETKNGIEVGADDAPEENGPSLPRQRDYSDHDDDPTGQMKETDNLHSPEQLSQSVNERTFPEDEDSNFFSYFMFISVMFIAGYVIYHNKQKILALLLEGRRDRNSRRRPNTASYRKLNSNLEEAVTSKCSSSASHVIY